MGENILKILEQNNCDTSLIRPPDNFETTDNPVYDVNLSGFDTSELLRNVGLLSSDANLSNEEKYIRIKRFYLYQINMQKEQEMIKEDIANIKNILENGNIEEIKEIFQRRRQWAESSRKCNPELGILCNSDSCINNAVPFSDYCIAHIYKDANQNLFVRCEECGHVYPKAFSCLYCKK